MNSKYIIILSNKFLKDLERLKRRKDFNSKLLKEVLSILSNGENLDKKYKDHKLEDSRNYKNCRECHISNDCLLVYRIEKEELLLLLIRTGSHSDLFK